MEQTNTAAALNLYFAARAARPGNEHEEERENFTDFKLCPTRQAVELYSQPGASLETASHFLNTNFLQNGETSVKGVNHMERQDAHLQKTQLEVNTSFGDFKTSGQ